MNRVTLFAVAAALSGTTFAVVTVGEVPPVVLCAGDTVTVVLPIEIAEGFHIQANPASNEFLIPVTLTFGAGDSTVSTIPEYPEPELLTLEGTTEGLATYSGDAGLAVTVHARADAPPGKRSLVGELRYQACDARRCYFPASVPVILTVVVIARDASPVRR